MCNGTICSPDSEERHAKGNPALLCGMGTPLESREEQATEVVDRLHEEYPDSTISLNYSSRLELLIAVVLSAQCTDERVNEVTADLFEKYQSAEDYAEALRSNWPRTSTVSRSTTTRAATSRHR